MTGYTIQYDDGIGEGDYWFATLDEALRQARKMAAAKLPNGQPKYRSVAAYCELDGFRVFHCDNEQWADLGVPDDTPALNPPWWESR
jgi:hypothetical protein